MVYEIPAGLDYLNPMFGLYVCWLSPISDVSFQVPDVESGGFEEQRARALNQCEWVIKEPEMLVEVSTNAGLFSMKHDETW